MSPVLDRWARPLGALRISVTDRCNLRCRYCMPEDEYEWLPRASLLSFEDITRLARVFASLGTAKIRLTGGEPLLRSHLEQLIAMLKAIPGISDIALTTNGLLLAPAMERLRSSGLQRITVSLDTLHPERMAQFARSSRHADVIAGIDAAVAAGFNDLKLNTVVVRGYNDDELITLVRFAKARDIEIRFIEYMDVGGATRWRRDDVVSRQEILASLEATFGPSAPVSRESDPHAPAARFRFADGTVVGIISSTTAPFCRDCDRARITADGTLFLCLYADQGIDLRGPLRQGATDGELATLVRNAWEGREDRGAEARAAIGYRGILVPLEGLRADPRREMHVRGG